MLLCKKLHADAILPTVAHPGEDLGFDLYALEDTVLLPGKVTPVRTGISARFVNPNANYGLLYRDRSSMAMKGITVSGGVIDSGYSGELKVLMTLNPALNTMQLKAGDKIVQMIPTTVHTDAIIRWVEELPDSTRQAAGFGSSGK